MLPPILLQDELAVCGEIPYRAATDGGDQYQQDRQQPAEAYVQCLLRQAHRRPGRGAKEASDSVQGAETRSALERHRGRPHRQPRSRRPGRCSRSTRSGCHPAPAGCPRISPQRRALAPDHQRSTAKPDRVEALGARDGPPEQAGREDAGEVDGAEQVVECCRRRRQEVGLRCRHRSLLVALDLVDRPARPRPPGPGRHLGEPGADAAGPSTGRAAPRAGSSRCVLLVPADLTGLQARCAAGAPRRPGRARSAGSSRRPRAAAFAQ